jgi:hypothetical protein
MTICGRALTSVEELAQREAEILELGGPRIRKADE